MRVKTGPITRRRHKKWLKLSKGYFGHKSIGYKVAKQAVIKSWTYAFRDRKTIKRNFRKLWISRINAAVKLQGMSYSHFINGLKKSNVNINRKMLSELAIREPEVFEKLVQMSKQAV